MYVYDCICHMHITCHVCFVQYRYTHKYIVNLYVYMPICHIYIYPYVHMYMHKHVYVCILCTHVTDVLYSSLIIHG